MMGTSGNGFWKILMSKIDESEKVSQVNNRRLFAMGRLVLLFVLAIA